MSAIINRLTALGQSLWYDNIQRRLLENGKLQDLIASGDIRGVTSNPSIFHNAIAKTNDYDSALVPLAWSGWDAESIFWQLAMEDIVAACDLFLPLYQQTTAGDGYVSLEVSPLLANKTAETIAQAKHLWQEINRPNLMIKIPATKAGIPAIRAVIAEGINVNVTLIFSLQRYAKVMEAYLLGLEDCVAAGKPISQIASVASFFISRLDSKVDALLPENSALRGKAAIANAKLAYNAFEAVFTQSRFQSLKARHSARAQRPLWASTSTKNPAYPETLYIDNLIGPDTVNTVPPATLDAFRQHGQAEITLTRNLDSAREQIMQLEAQGVSLTKATVELESEGVQAFEEAFVSLLSSIEERRLQAIVQLGPMRASVAQRINTLAEGKFSERMHAGDASLWTENKAEQSEVRQRLGWLRLPETSRNALGEINAFAAHVRQAGFSKVLLLGMGGSSLAPEVLSLVFAPTEIQFAILDSTDPAQVLEAANNFPVKETLFIVASKSGGTVEVNATFQYFWNKASKELGQRAGQHFVAITDPGTKLEKLARERNFLKVFSTDETVGGRYSALTYFGLVPAALMGINTEALLDKASWMSAQCAPSVLPFRNPGLVLGAILGQAALEGRNKLTILADALTAPMGAWLEQLIAESSGKQDKGIVVVEGETILSPEAYRADRIFIYLRHDGGLDKQVAALQKTGLPVLVFPIADAYDLGAEFFRWEVATVVACSVLNVNAFDQPDVQDNKNRTQKKIIAYNEEGGLREVEPAWQAGEVRAYSELALKGESLQEMLKAFLSFAQAGDYVAINAYLPRNKESSAMLQQIRDGVQRQTGCATTLDFGPRFLHSTGQLHKGGPEQVVFLQITAEPEADIEIPEMGVTFGTLERAQALGDYEALVARDRRILRMHLPSPQAVSLISEAL